jgi:DNA repair protein RadC
MVEYNLKITKWPKDERPRERLLRRGSQNLSDAELLGILIAKGTKDKTAVDLGRELLMKYGSLRDLSSRSPAEYSTIKGIGEAKSVIISTAFEVSRRVQSQPDVIKVIFKKSKDVADYYIPLMRDLKKEVFKVALLDGANKLIRDITVSEGTLNTSVVHPREVFRDALIEATTGVVLVHNHPSGDPTPSDDDVKITKQLVEAGQIFGIRVFDHIIVAEDRFKSLADEGLI